MDYEKKYKEALAHAREIHRNEEEKRRDMEFIFSELKESEDERIRKELISYHRSMAAAMNGNRPCVHEAWIAWLEKQGENSICKVKIGEKYKCIASPRYTCFFIGDIYEVTDDFIAKLINLCSDCFVLLEKQGTSYTKRDVDDAYVEGMAFAKDELEKQKPTWSEEDEVRLQACIDTLQAKSIMGKVDTIQTNWLKSIKQRIGG